MVVLVVEGLSFYHFMAYESMFSHITSKLEHRVKVVTPAEYGGSSINVIDDDNFDKNDQVRLVVAESDKQAIKRASEIAMEHAFTLCHIRLEEEELKNDHIEITFRTVNKCVHKLWQHMEVNGLARLIQNIQYCKNIQYFTLDYDN